MTMATLTRAEVVAAFKTLVASGLTFADCIGAYGVDRKTNSLAREAFDQYQEDGAIEIDDTTVISESDGGSYVMAWVWVGAD
jgi:hypothetical protein